MQKKTDLRMSYLCLQATREGQASFSHVHEIISGLSKRGWVVRLFQPDYFEKPLYSRFIVRLFLFILVQVRAFFAKKANVYYFRWHFALFPLALLFRIFKIPVVQEINGTLLDLYVSYPWTKKFERFFRYLALKQLFWADRIIAVTPELCRWADRITRSKKSFHVTNGANVEIFRPDAQSVLFKPELCPYIIFFGSLSEWQGIDIILQATLHEEWPEDVKLLVIGGGRLEEMAIKFSSEHKNVYFWKSIPQKHLAGLISKSLAGISIGCVSPLNYGQKNSEKEKDIKCVISENEVSKIYSKSSNKECKVSPVKSFEIMACQVPVIVSEQYSNIKQLVGEGAGIAIKRTPEVLARTVKFLHSNPEIRDAMGKKGREMVLKNFTWDIAAEKTHNVLLELSSREGIK
ncbi:MAG: glycosyltransferase [Candidatus Riflebacteria bacterium]|nr:glycosyltransferase [Candidatus Riflebacteria bacterium]